ncbi:MAG: glycosyltransferase [Desulfobacula sp.]|nr:glycosyltransferase [Desulfobacula sp.]
MKIGFVVQRYGEEVFGGAEFHCKMVAEHLSKYYDIEIITTCAIDYITWKNEYSAGKNNVNGITVWRFPVDYSRDMDKFNTYSEKILWGEHCNKDEIKWMKLQGPYSTQLLDYLRNNKDSYDLFIFFTYLYCTTFFGLPLVKDKAMLVPTAHDEPTIYLKIFKLLFKQPKARSFNTEEENKFINTKFKNKNIPSEIIGVGIDVPGKIDGNHFIKKYKLENFIIYVGRIDESKGCNELFDFFIRYKNETKSGIKLVLTGKAVMKVPDNPDIIYIGTTSEQDKFNGIKAAKFLIMPSKYESLSLVILETWICNNAVLVNGKCDVLKGHCLRSNGGLYYTNYEEFKEIMDLFLINQKLLKQMGKNGHQYVLERYEWAVVEEKYINFIQSNLVEKNLKKRFQDLCVQLKLRFISNT